MACLAISNPKKWVNGCFQIPGKENRQHWANLVGSRKNKCLSYTWTFGIFLKLKTSQKTSQKHTGPLVSAGYLGSIFSDHLSPNPLWTRPSFLAWEWRIHSIWQPNGSKQVSARINESTTHTTTSLSEISWCREWCSTVVKLKLFGTLPQLCIVLAAVTATGWHHRVLDWLDLVLGLPRTTVPSIFNLGRVWEFQLVPLIGGLTSDEPPKMTK